MTARALIDHHAEDFNRPGPTLKDNGVLERNGHTGGRLSKINWS